MGFFSDRFVLIKYSQTIKSCRVTFRSVNATENVISLAVVMGGTHGTTLPRYTAVLYGTIYKRDTINEIAVYSKIIRSLFCVLVKIYC